MIRLKWNLRCAAGHYHYSPTPGSFVGLSCSKPFANPLTVSGDLRRTVPRCPERLGRVDGTRVKVVAR